MTIATPASRHSIALAPAPKRQRSEQVVIAHANDLPIRVDPTAVPGPPPLRTLKEAYIRVMAHEDPQVRTNALLVLSQLEQTAEQKRNVLLMSAGLVPTLQPPLSGNPRPREEETTEQVKQEPPAKKSKPSQS